MTAQPVKFGLKLSVKLYVTCNYSSVQMYIKKIDEYYKKLFFNNLLRKSSDKKSLNF